MEQLFTWLGKFFGSWKAWIVIAPWDVGVRVRLGRLAKSLPPGFHWRIPCIDSVALVNTRLRFATTPPVTVTGKRPGVSRCITANIGFRITDPLKALMAYGNPESAVTSVAMREMATSASEGACLLALRGTLFAQGAIEIDSVCFVEDVEVRTYRLMQGLAWGILSGGHEPTQPTWRY